MDDCHICQKNSINFTYKCCNQSVCKKCSDDWYYHNKTCPFCRTLVVRNSDSLVNNFKEWLILQNIDIRNLDHDLIGKLRKIDDIFTNNNNPFVYIQVANLQKIHVFKYKNETRH